MAKRSLDALRVLTPCPLAAGFQEPVSHCRVCGRDVLDLSSFTREEAARILSTAEPPCVRFVLRDEKPVFRQVARAAVVATVLAGAATATALAVTADPAPPPLVYTAKKHIDPAPAPTNMRVTGGIPPRAEDWH